jgi:hypothetical protein
MFDGKDKIPKGGVESRVGGMLRMTQCDRHEKIIDRVAKIEASGQEITRVNIILEGQTNELFDKYNDINKELNIVKTDIVERLARIESNQKTYYDKISELCSSFKDFKEATSKKLDEIDKFKWFRDRLNKWRDNSLGVIMWIILGIIFMLVAIQDISFSKILKFFRIGG